MYARTHTEIRTHMAFHVILTQYQGLNNIYTLTIRNNRLVRILDSVLDPSTYARTRMYAHVCTYTMTFQ